MNTTESSHSDSNLYMYVCTEPGLKPFMSEPEPELAKGESRKVGAGARKKRAQLEQARNPKLQLTNIYSNY